LGARRTKEMHLHDSSVMNASDESIRGLGGTTGQRMNGRRLLAGAGRRRAGVHS
jgi:hypothetical protein